MKNLLLILLIVFLTLSLSAQTRKINQKKTSSSIKTNKKIDKTKIISFGVINGKAINLVKPIYPATARGSVSVSVLIDEEGKVITANAISGHPLLRAVSVKAALASTFEPIKLSGKPVKISGIIIYKFIAENYNWLEIGNNADDLRFIKMLPLGFAEEKKTYEQYESSDYETQKEILENVKISIEGKLISEPKKLWLFQIGILLNKFSGNNGEDELKEKNTKLKTLLVNVPQNVSPYLISRLEKIVNLIENPKLNTYDPINGSKLYQELKELEERLPVLGN